jgi:hypothetical protein
MAQTKVTDRQVVESIDLTTEVVNTLPVGNGGTGTTSLTGLVKGNGASAFSAAAAGTDYLTPGATQTVTATRVTKRVVTVTNSATPTVNSDNADVAELLNLTNNITAVSVTGTPTNEQQLMWKIKSAAAQTIVWGTSFLSSGVATLLAATVAGKLHRVLTVYDTSVSKWVCIAVDATGY